MIGPNMQGQVSPPLTPVVPPFCIVGTDAVNNSLF